MTKTIAVCLVLALICGVCCGAMAEAEVPRYRSLKGKITEIRDLYEIDGSVRTGVKSVLIKTGDDALANFHVAESVLEEGKTFADLKIGGMFEGVFDTSLPMLMIYPPQYVAVSAVIQ